MMRLRNRLRTQAQRAITLATALAAFRRDDNIFEVTAEEIAEALFGSTDTVPVIAEKPARYTPSSMSDGDISFQRSFTPLPAALDDAEEFDEWLLAFSSSFRKATSHIDRKLQGRVLDALNELCRDPLKARGDTVKPLTHTRKGLWRYRIDDYRLIYRPNTRLRRIELIAFEPRGAVYE